MKRTALKRRTPLAAIPAVVRYAVYSRDQFRCQRCGDLIDEGMPFSLHHRKPRRMGGRQGAAAVESYDMANLITVCGNGVRRCHGDIEADRSQASDDGWLLRELEDPRTTPLIRYDGHWWLAGDSWTEWGQS